ncbi:hypothetical protein T439DRAFT_354699 [Meredithblackwellia eburnea MCA 4105]
MTIISHRDSRLILCVLLTIQRVITISALLLGAAGQAFLLVQNLRDRARNQLGQDDAYFGAQPGISTQKGGTVGFATGHIMTFLILLSGAVSETPLPQPLYLWSQQAWDAAFPPFSEYRGVGVLASIMLLFGSLQLGQDIRDFPRIAAWFLFVVGWINLPLGIFFRGSIHYYRSFTALSDIDDDTEEENAHLPGPATASLKSSLHRSNRGSIVVHPEPPPIAAAFSRDKIVRDYHETPVGMTNKHLRFAVPSFLRKSMATSVSVYSQKTFDDSGGHVHEHEQEGVPPVPPVPLPISATWSREDRSRLGPMTQVSR